MPQPAHCQQAGCKKIKSNILAEEKGKIDGEASGKEKTRLGDKKDWEVSQLRECEKAAI